MTQSSQGNLVGSVVLKDIYIVKNTVNDMVYIGQAKNTYERWKGHKTAAKTGHFHGRCLLYDAMRKYGIDKFHYEILEKQIPNYNEREQYWISFYNSVTPNGYNLLSGGEQYPNLKGVMNAGAAIKSEQELESVISDLKTSRLTLVEIAKKYNVPLNTIHGVNSGETYFDASRTYPIRKEVVRKLTGDDVRCIIGLLQQSNMTIVDIAKKFCVSGVTINCINIGDTHSNILPEIARPIRRVPAKYSHTALNEAQIMEAIKLITDTSLSYRDIAARYGVDHRVILRIKNGQGDYRQDGLSYPLRPIN